MTFEEFVAVAHLAVAVFSLVLELRRR